MKSLIKRERFSSQMSGLRMECMASERPSKKTSTTHHPQPPTAQQASSSQETSGLPATDHNTLNSQLLNFSKPSPEIVLSLQRRYGNQYVQRLLSLDSLHSSRKQVDSNLQQAYAQVQADPKPKLPPFSLIGKSLQRTIYYRGSDEKLKPMASGDDPFAILDVELTFRWYLNQVIEAGKTKHNVSDALDAMRDDTKSNWIFGKPSSKSIREFFAEVDRRLGLNKPTWDYSKYSAESQKSNKGSTVKATTEPKQKETSYGQQEKQISTPSTHIRKPTQLGDKEKKPSHKSSKAEVTTTPTATKIDKGNVLGPFVEATKERSIKYEVNGLTGNPIRTIYVSSEEKAYLDEMYELAKKTMEKEEYPTWGELKKPGARNDIPQVGFEIELKGMYIDVSKNPTIAAAMAIAGHKPIAQSGNIQIHIDAAAGSGKALIEIVTEPLLIDKVASVLTLIKSKIVDKETLLNWVEEIRGGEKAEEQNVKEEEAEKEQEEQPSEVLSGTPKNLILDYVLKNPQKITYSKYPVHVQLTTSLTEKEFAGPIAEHTRFKHPSGNTSLAKTLENTPPKTKHAKHGYALIKHAYEQLAEAKENSIPTETRVDKVPFPYNSGDEVVKTANLHTEANKIAPLINRKGERAFLVEYRGGAASTKSFIGDIKKYLEGKEDKIEAVIASIQDAFPHLKPKNKD